MKKNINFNIKTQGFFQKNQITELIHNYLNSDKIMNNIIKNNKYKNRYNNNNDCFIHIRLGDVERYNPGFMYYDYIISKLEFDNLYISTDTENHIIINNLKNKYPNLKIYNSSLDDIILFGSTCKYVILSYGTFSAVIGYLSFYSNVYYNKYSEKYAWDYKSKNNMFINKCTKIGNWKEINID